MVLFFEGSCDTEDWSNDADNSALPSQEEIPCIITIYSNRKLSYYILRIFYNIKNKCNLGEHKA